MHVFSARRPFRVRFLLLAGLALLIAVAIAALALGPVPADLARLAHQPDAQVAIFLVPLTLLVMGILFEAMRISWHGRLPGEVPARRRARSPWTPRP